MLLYGALAIGFGTPIDDCTAMNNQTMQRLDFIGIGVQRAATTWVFRCLEEHPSVRGALVANDKELNFFNHDFYKGYHWYHAQFEFGPWKTGEFSVLYFCDNNVPERIHHYNPDIKLLLCLRNPVDRAFSHHLHEIMRNRLPKNLYGFSDALKHNPSYIEMGRYATQLEHYLKLFTLSQIHVILLDDITSKPATVMRNLFRFLEVDDKFSPSLLEKRVNISHKYKSRILDNLMRHAPRIIEEILGNRLYNAIKLSKLPPLIRSFNEAEFPKSITNSLSLEERKYLCEIFSEENRRLADYIKRDLSNWK